MNMVHYEGISLKQLVERSDFIFIVSKSAPFTTIRKIDFNDPEKECPPFSHTVYHFKVVRELLNKNDKPMPGQEIEVSPAHLGADLYLHKKYYLEGISKSPIYDKYETKADFDQDKQLIIFLRVVNGQEYEFYTEGSYESISQENLIVDIVRSLPLPTSWLLPSLIPDKKPLSPSNIKDELRYIKAAEFEGVIFPSSYAVNYISLNTYGRWDPAQNDIIEAEKISKSYLQGYKGDNKSYEGTCIPKILNELKEYKRQYFGLIDKNGDKVIWINFISHSVYEWKNTLVMVKDGGYKYFQIKVNLKTKKAFDLAINGEA